MFDHTSKNFRILREIVGCTQDELADALGAEPDDIERWESQSGAWDQGAPEEAWTWLELVYRMQSSLEESGFYYIDPHGECGAPVDPDDVTILLRSQGQYEQIFLHPGDIELYKNCAVLREAIWRKVAELLPSKGIEIKRADSIAH